MTKLFLSMPQPGETITEGTLVQWLIKVGSEIKEGAPLAELETEKAVFEYESPFDGKILEILCQNGERVKVSTPIAVVEVAKEKADMYLMMGIAKSVDSGTTSQQVKTLASLSTRQQAGVVTSSAKFDTQGQGSSAIKLSPYIRKLIKQFQLNMTELQKFANAENRITLTVIKDLVVGKIPVVTSAPQTSPNGAYTVKPCSAIRMRIADNMVKSKSKIPHAHNGISVDVTSLIAYREKHKVAFQNKHGVSLGFLTLLFPALISALKKFPVLNASYDDSTNPHQIKYFNSINLGIAAGTEKGLVIPVVHGCETLTPLTFNLTLAQKMERAQKQKLTADDLTGSTLLFNNFGYFGTQIGVQVIQYPLAATLGMSALERRVVPLGNSDQIGIRTMCDFILAFDHRVMDGRETGQFLSELKKQIECEDFAKLT